MSFYYDMSLPPPLYPPAPPTEAPTEASLLKRLIELKQEEPLLEQDLLVNILSSDDIPLTESEIAQVVYLWVIKKGERLIKEKEEEEAALHLAKIIPEVNSVVRLGNIGRDELLERWLPVTILGSKLFEPAQIHEACKKEIREITPKRNAF